MQLFYYCYFERNYDVLKSKGPCFLLSKNLKFNKNETEWKVERWTMCFSLYKNCQLKVKLWWVGACGKKKSAFFVPFILLEGNFFKICVLSQCIVYWINLQNIFTFSYQKALLHTLLLLVFKYLQVAHWLDFFQNKKRLNGYYEHTVLH